MGKKLIGFIRALWQLNGYLTLGLPVFIVLLPTAFWMNNSKTIKRIWIWFDRIVATCIHFTWKRTISSITGQYMDSKLRYKYQAKVIDWLFKLLGDGPNHSYRAYRWERMLGLVK